MSLGDSKCTNTDSCIKSAFGTCTKCDVITFLDKTDNLCKYGGVELYGCKISLDGKTCSECNDGFFLSEDGLCSKSQNCAKRNANNVYCAKCSEGYFLAKSGDMCTSEEHCYRANYDFGFCVMCEDSYYLDDETKKCFSNQEDEKFKFCSKVSSGNCINCETGYEFADDNKCEV